MIGSPMRETRQRKHRTGPLVLYLSPNQAEAYIKTPEKAYGGAPRHWDIAVLKLRFVLRMIGRKKANAYAMVVTRKRMMGKP